MDRNGFSGRVGFTDHVLPRPARNVVGETDHAGPLSVGAQKFPKVPRFQNENERCDREVMEFERVSNAKGRSHDRHCEMGVTNTVTTSYQTAGT